MTPINRTLENLRGTYSHANFGISDAQSNPVVQFEKWISDAIDAACDEPNAFTLSTIHDNRPRSRVLLCKGFHENKLIFYTNFMSQKGHELEENPFAAMNFLWLPLQRQVRIEGKISKVAESVSDEYFASRPRGSQLGAIASPQSQVVDNRSCLEDMFIQTEKIYNDIDLIPRPTHWGGYALEADYFEFWQGRENRMHDRIAYQLNNGIFNRVRLAP